MQPIPFVLIVNKQIKMWNREHATHAECGSTEHMMWTNGLISYSYI
jgi:hypothetical protein